MSKLVSQSLQELNPKSVYNILKDLMFIPKEVKRIVFKVDDSLFLLPVLGAWRVLKKVQTSTW